MKDGLWLGSGGPGTAEEALEGPPRCSTRSRSVSSWICESTRFPPLPRPGPAPPAPGPVLRCSPSCPLPTTGPTQRPRWCFSTGSSLSSPRRRRWCPGGRSRDAPRWVSEFSVSLDRRTPGVPVGPVCVGAGSARLPPRGSAQFLCRGRGGVLRRGDPRHQLCVCKGERSTKFCNSARLWDCSEQYV